jgi:hypothetical protein
VDLLGILKDGADSVQGILQHKTVCVC